jgi:signal peptidase I
MTPGRSILRDLLEALLIAVIFATFARTFVFQAFKIPSASMEENLLVGDHIIVNKFVYGPTASRLEALLLPVRDPRRGDVIVFKYPDNPHRDFIKRAVGLPRETVEVRAQVVHVEGEPLAEEGYAHHLRQPYPDSQWLGEDYRRADHFGPYRVPAGHYFFMGDNRDNSQDSRYWRQPAVPRHYLKGRAFAVYWSFAGVPGGGGAGLRARLARVGRVARHFFAQTRWERSGRLVR